MSVRLYKWAWAQRGIGSTARLVLLSLVERADNRTHECFPSQGVIAADVEMQSKAVGRAIKKLEALGLISREPRRRSDGYRTSDRYRLHVETFAGTDDRGSSDRGSDDTESGDSEQGLIASSVRSHPSIGPTFPDRESERKESIRHPIKQPINRPIRGTVSDSTVTFEDFWSAYPRKKSKEAARKAWSKAIVNADPARIVEAARSYDLQQRTEDPRYTPYPASWLNAGRWEDQPDAVASITLAPKNRKLLTLVERYASGGTNGQDGDGDAPRAALGARREAG